MSDRPLRTNYAILAAFVVAVLAAGAAIVYFGGGTEEHYEPPSPAAHDPTVERGVRDGLSPALTGEGR